MRFFKILCPYIYFMEYDNKVQVLLHLQCTNSLHMGTARTAEQGILSLCSTTDAYTIKQMFHIK